MYNARETWCVIYNLLGEIPMETLLYHTEYQAFNHDLDGNHPWDDHLYYMVFDCGFGP
jgi:hypothetical protein